MNHSVLVVGELNADIIVSDMSGFPSLGREILASEFHIVLGSSSAICAAGMAQLGLSVDFLGKVGLDHLGTFVVDELRQLGVGPKHIFYDKTVSTGVTISLTETSDRAMITHLGSISELCLSEIDLSILHGYDHIHVGSYFLQQKLQPGLAELFRASRRAGLTVSLDTGYDPNEMWGGDNLWELLRLVDVFLPNDREANAIAACENVETALQRLARQAGLVVVKCGSAGSMAVADSRVIRSPALPVDVKDTTGAGDSFNAGFIFAYLIRERSLKESLDFANACGALSATGFGGTANQPTHQEVDAFLRRQQNR
jgi:sugar/nucleoside kinase (ribokinase family)